MKTKSVNNKKTANHMNLVLVILPSQFEVAVPFKRSEIIADNIYINTITSCVFSIQICKNLLIKALINKLISHKLSLFSGLFTRLREGLVMCVSCSPLLIKALLLRKSFRFEQTGLF